MAWNQSGGDKGPWGRRTGQGGTALDERLKRWQRRLESLLRLSGEGEGGALLLVLGAIAVVLWLASGFFQIGAAERGVVERFGQLVEVRAPGRGWHWPWPIETVTRVNVMAVASRELGTQVLTADLNVLEVHADVQYRLASPLKVLFAVRSPEETLQELGESALREALAQQSLRDALAASTRPQLASKLRTTLQQALDRYGTGIELSSVNLLEVQVPDAVQAAQRDADDKAPADADRAVKEAQAYASGLAPQAQGYADKTQQDAQAYRARVLALAQGQAELFTQVAQAYARAPGVTRERLYLETLEDIYARSSKVFVEAKTGAGGNVLYLPIDRLASHAGSGSTSGSEAQPAESAARPAPSDADTITVEGRSRGER